MGSCKCMRLEEVTNGLQPLQTNNLSKQMNPPMDKSEQKVDLHNKETIINKDEVETVVDKLNQLMEPLRTNLKFQYHEKLDEYYVTVINPQTNEVIKEIPPKKMLDMYAEMAEFMGILIDKKI